MTCLSTTAAAAVCRRVSKIRFKYGVDLGISAVMLLRLLLVMLLLLIRDGRLLNLESDANCQQEQLGSHRATFGGVWIYFSMR